MLLWPNASCSSESALTVWESSDVRKGNCNKEEEVEEKQMRLRDEKRDHLFQTLITLLPCSSVSPSPWSSSSPTQSITFLSFHLDIDEFSNHKISRSLSSSSPREAMYLEVGCWHPIKRWFQACLDLAGFWCSNALLLIVGESPSLD